VNDQVVSIFAGTQGYLDDLPNAKVPAFEAALLRHVNDEFPEIIKDLDETGALSDENTEKLKSIVADFKVQFVAKSQD
jgi:F-type H+-transporting ATPase subunit alpha